MIHYSIEGEFDMLETGIAAPDFKLMDKNGNPVSLSDFRGKKVVVYFYPKMIPRDVFAKHAHFAMHMTASKRRILKSSESAR
jgi:peroxiredoxin